MILETIVIVGVVVVMVIVLWRKLQPHVTTSDLSKKPSFLPNKATSRGFLIFCGVLGYLLAIDNLVSQRAPSKTGLFSWFTGRIYEQFGSYGMTVWWVFLGTVVILMAVLSPHSK